MRTNRSAGPISFLFKDIHLIGHSNQFIRNADYLKFVLVTFIYSVDLIEL